ncbi:outer membrane autotransporter [Pandoraea horticolens]|uniref:Outer membrane autotransporter n=1 Tax=Pandoraea horticolens TaxID=2508298 RepID=A0A5E4VN75_9BURK|nr:autotransporter domain-containing protein [Pandoraea horticolens]VVE13752.1 outer membrane autotransporter [Pandoraea horticolens]
MNHAYRVVWNGALGIWQAVSELAASHTKGAGLRRRVAASAVMTLSLGLATPLAHAIDVLLVGTGGLGGGDGGNGSIAGGNGAQDFFLPGSGGAASIPSPTQVIPGTATGGGLPLSTYDYMGIGGGAGGGDGGNLGGINGGTGGAGVLNLTGTALSVTNTLLIGGAGGGGGSGGAGSTRGGNGGTGGSGTLTATGGATITVGTQLYLGGLGGTGGNCGCSGNGGAGGAGILNLGDGSTLNLTGGAFTINGSGTLNIGNATANGATAGTVTGLVGSINNAGTINFNQSDASYTFSTNIAGTGKVVQNGSGTTFLTGANLYTGGTTVNAGLINFTSGGNLGSGNVTLDGGGLQWATGNTTDISSRLTALGANGGTLDTNGNNVTLASGISGAGGLTKSGAGTLTLTSTNGYTGGTTITNGTLALGTGGSLASTSSVDLANAGTQFSISGGGAQTIGALLGVAGSTVNLGSNALTVTANTNGTFGGSITGTGGVTLAGTGTQTLAGANAYTGTTTISAGTLALTGGGSIANASGLINNGIFDISGTAGGTTVTTLSGTGTVALGGQTLTLSNASGTFSGGIAGTGGLTLNGGTQTLSGVNAYTGATTVNAGTLALAGAGNLSEATTVSLAGSGATLDLSAGGNQSVAHLSGVSGSRVALGANILTLTDNTSQTFGGSLTGSGSLVKQGTGTLTLNGISSAFTGTTTISDGTVAVGDAASASAMLGGNVQVSTQGTLRGHGTVSGNVNNSGVVAPGGSIGTLAVSGNYAQAATGTLSIEVSPTQGSQLRVGGAAALGGTLAIVYDPGTYTARQYTLLTAANGVTGRFGNVTNTTTAGANLGTLQSSVNYGANEVDLTLAAAAGSSADPLVVAPTNTSIYTAVGTTALLQAQGANAALLGRLGNLQSGLVTSTDAWATATGTSTKVGGTGSAPGFLTHEYGFLAGADRQLGNATVGAAGGYTHTTLGEDGTGASGAIDTLRLALYGNQPVGAINVSGTLGYGLNFLSQKRPFGSMGTAEGDHIGHEFTAATQASLPVQVAGFTLAPHVGLRYAYVRGSGFTEDGANGQNLQVGADNARSLQPYVGMTLDKAFGDAARPVTVQLRLGYAREVLSGGRVVQVQSQDGTMFAASGTDLPRSFLTTGASVSWRASKTTAVSLGMDALINTSHVSAQSAYVRVNHRF